MVGLTSLSDVLTLMAALAAAIMASVLFYAKWRRAAEINVDSKLTEERLFGVIGSSPLEYICWIVANGQEFILRRFSVLFEGGIKSFAEMASKFPAEDYKKLEAAVEGLRKEGRSFAQTLRSTDGTCLGGNRRKTKYGAMIPPFYGQYCVLHWTSSCSS